MFDKNFFWGLGVGVIAGAIGYKLYNDNKQTIMNSLESLKNKMSKEVPPELAVATEPQSETTEIDLAELEKQKEHLEDLIAEQQVKNNEEKKD